MKLTSTKQKAKFVNLLIHGKHGSGKTPLSCTAPKPLIIDLEEGLQSVAKLDLPVFEVRSFGDLEEAYKDTKKIIKKTPTKFETVIMDGGHELADIVLEGLKADPELKDKRHAYMKMAEETKFWIRKFRDLKINFILNNISDIIEIDDVEKYRVYFPGNVLPKEIPGMFNQIFCLHYDDEDEEEKMVLQCKRCIDYDARDRSGNLKKFEKMDLTYLFKKIQGKK